MLKEWIQKIASYAVHNLNIVLAFTPVNTYNSVPEEQLQLWEHIHRSSRDGQSHPMHPKGAATKKIFNFYLLL